MKLFIKLFLWLMLLTSSIHPLSAAEGVFLSAISVRNGTNSSTGTRLTSIDVFQKNLGASTPVQWARQLPATANAERFFASAAWQNTRNDILGIYGNKVQVNQYLDYQEYLFLKQIRINNIASSRSLNIKGNVAETIMDDFYLKDGWERIDGKRGRNGFDGLYVKRTPKGEIYDWIAADAKSGNSKLNNTLRGKQLSPEWTKANLKDLLESAKMDYKKTPTDANFKRVQDLEQILKLKGRSPRVFSMKIEQINGKVQVVFRNIDVNGKTIGRPMLVDMQAGKASRIQHKIYNSFKKHIAVYDSKNASSLVGKIEMGFKKGKIKNDSDLYRVIKRNIPDKRLADAIVQELGETPPRGSLAKVVGKQICSKPTLIHAGSAAVIAGFIVTKDLFSNGLSSDTFVRAGMTFTAIVGTGVILDATIPTAIKKTSQILARHSLSLAGRKASEQAVSRMADKIALSLGKGGGNRSYGGILRLFHWKQHLQLQPRKYFSNRYDCQCQYRCIDYGGQFFLFVYRNRRKHRIKHLPWLGNNNRSRNRCNRRCRQWRICMAC